MFFRNATMAILAVLVVALFTSSTTNALDSSNDAQKTNYTIGNGTVILHSFIGDVNIPIPPEIQAELEGRVHQNNEERSGKLTLIGNNDNIHSKGFADFFECNEQAQLALSVHSENFRNWEAFFKRNSISDTVAVSIVAFRNVV